MVGSREAGRHDTFAPEGFVLPASLGEVLVESITCGGRRVPGSERLTRCSESWWAIRVARDALCRDGRFWALPWNPVAVSALSEGPPWDGALVRAGRRAPPTDLVVFRRKDRDAVDDCLREFGGPPAVAHLDEQRRRLLLNLALAAISCRGLPSRIAGTVVPSWSGRDGDLLRIWEDRKGVPVHLWAVHRDRATGTLLRDARRTKRGLRFTDSATYEAGVFKTGPSLRASLLHADDGALLPYLYWFGGPLTLGPTAITALSRRVGNAQRSS